MIESYTDGVIRRFACNVFLQCDYSNRGHLDEVDQSHYGKITIHTTH